MTSHSHEHVELGGVLIIGAGLAGLYMAIKLAPRPCWVIAPNGPGQGASSAWAQGGVAAALSPTDSPQAHAADTIAVGADLVDRLAADLICAAGPALVHDLASLGAPFDRDADGRFRLSREAAHAAPRVARVMGDGAGRAITKAVAMAARTSPNTTLWAGLTAQALLADESGRVAGCTALDRDKQAIVTIQAEETVLAAGGVGALYAVTTNPPAADGAPVALAARAGAIIADPEFVQFHPTALNVGVDPAPLATEALRGDGAVIVDAKGQEITDPLGPRDQVARAVHEANRDGRGAYLDARRAIGTNFPKRYPTVFAACQAANLDPTRETIPIAPAAHYHMGGVMTSLDGATSLEGLWAVGEAARTGMHGANRLASNSLLEAGVLAERAAQRLRNTSSPAPRQLRPMTPPPAINAADRTALKKAMSEHVGVARTHEGLSQALSIIQHQAQGQPLTNPALAASVIVHAALARKESRGAHHRTDAPSAVADPKPTGLTWSADGRMHPCDVPPQGLTQGA